MTGDNLIDTPIKLAQCNRCQAWTYLAMSSGLRSAADVIPPDRGAYIIALTEGRRLFRITDQAGRPHKLLTVRPADLKPSFDQSGTQAGPQRLFAEHGCGSHALDAVTFTELPPAATPTVCEQWQASGWVPPAGKCGRQANPSLKGCPTCCPPPFDSAPTSGATAAVEALGAPLPPPEHRRRPEARQQGRKGQSSDLGPVRCHICRRLIDPDTPHVGIHHGRWVWAVHVECP